MKTRTVREVLAATALVVTMAVPALVTLAAQAPAQTSGQNGMPDLVGALKATPGVLGVELARTVTGKNVIFAWFENKQAVLEWYYSDAHQAMLRQFTDGRRRPAGPLADVPDDGRPILAVASVTLPTGAPPTSTADLRSTVAQIAIELYAPLPGGLAAGGRFSPSAMKVPGMLETGIPGQGNPSH
jgi:hypothetical protein